MQSRAELLVQRELGQERERLLSRGIEVLPIDSAPLAWHVLVRGLGGDAYFYNERTVLQARVVFADDHDDAPPLVEVLTIPFHPNIHPTSGQVRSRAGCARIASPRRLRGRGGGEGHTHHHTPSHTITHHHAPSHTITHHHTP